jgi:hypothetical protein
MSAEVWLMLANCKIENMPMKTVMANTARNDSISFEKIFKSWNAFIFISFDVGITKQLAKISARIDGRIRLEIRREENSVIPHSQIEYAQIAKQKI